MNLGSHLIQRFLRLAHPSAIILPIAHPAPN